VEEEAGPRRLPQKAYRPQVGVVTQTVGLDLRFNLAVRVFRETKEAMRNLPPAAVAPEAEVEHSRLARMDRELSVGLEV
jgi:hypothetical protein